MSYLSVIDEFDDYDMMTKRERYRLKQLKEEIRSVGIEEIEDELPRLFKQVAEIVLPRYDEGSSISRLEQVLCNRQLLETYKPLSGEEVVIMTLHKAKGLEFELVYHLNMNEWELPVKLPINGDWNNLCYKDEIQDLDLHYVGVTRAKKACVLITSTSRHSNGNVRKGSPSEFLTRNGVENLRKDIIVS